MIDIVDVLRNIELGSIKDANDAPSFDAEGHYVGLGQRQLESKVRRLKKFGDARYAKGCRTGIWVGVILLTVTMVVLEWLGVMHP